MQASQKYRLTVFIALILLLCTWSAMYAVEAYTMLYPVDGLSDKVNNVNIDGSDFTGLFKLGALALEGFLDSIIMTTYIIIMIVWSLVLLLIFRIVSIRKDSITSENEIKYAKISLWGCTLLIYLISIFMTGVSFVLTNLLLFWPIPLFGILFYILPLKSKHAKLKDSEQCTSFNSSQMM